MSEAYNQGLNLTLQYMNFLPRINLPVQVSNKDLADAHFKKWKSCFCVGYESGGTVGKSIDYGARGPVIKPKVLRNFLDLRIMFQSKVQI